MSGRKNTEKAQESRIKVKISNFRNLWVSILQSRFSWV